ncbi:kinase-like domain-containing protein, partial [Favolaschia claudopus]
TDFEVTDFILAREGHTVSTGVFTPSPASGVDSTAYSTLPDEEKEELIGNSCLISSVTWLLERERSNFQFRKFSGTLDHPHYTDKQGATINSFQHFTYLYSNRTLVLADIQASESGNPSTHVAILFDLMSHTIDGNSGAGDHGEAGIKSFVNQHKCVQKCAQMGLDSLKEPEEQSEADEDASESG